MIGEFFKTISLILDHPLNRKKRFAALRRYLGWQIGSRIVPGSVAVPFTDHARLLVAPGMTGATGNIYTGLCEFEDMAFVLHFLRPGDLFADIGANIGSYTMLAAAAAKATVVAVEPVPSTFDRLIANIRLNGLGDTVTALKTGVGSSDGSLWFSVAHDTQNHVLLNGAKSDAGIEVPVTTLDKLLAAKCPVLMKIDVEGFETEVMKGAQATLANKDLLGVILELNGSGVRYGYDDDAIHGTMLEAGFLPYRYEPFERSLTLLTKHNSSANTLYLRDVAFIEARLQAAMRYTVHGTSL